jgi:hypothetical protein
MKNVEIFKDWRKITEAVLTDHASERIKERVYSPKDILLPIEIENKFDTSEIEKIKKNILDRISLEIDDRFPKLRTTRFKKGIATGYPLISLYIQYLNKKYPLEIQAESENAEGISKLYTGNQIYIPIINNEIKTIKLYPPDLDNNEIDRNIALHIYSREEYQRLIDTKELKIEPMRQGDNYVLVLSLYSNGEVARDVDKKIEKSGIVNPDFYSKDQQYNLSPGKSIRITSKLGETGYLDGTLLRILNKKTIKDDKFLNLDLSVEYQGKKLTLAKKIGPGDIIFLPVGENKEYIKCKIADKPYLLDPRLEDPINLKFRAIRSSPGES